MLTGRGSIQVLIIALFWVLSWLAAAARAQSLEIADDPVVRARQRLHAMVDEKARRAERVLAAAGLSRESDEASAFLHRVAEVRVTLTPPPALIRPALDPASPDSRYHAYHEMLRRILMEENLPPELMAVARIESGFNRFALSPKGARGIWQLMPATAARYGLSVEAANDQRTHPEHSTRAAARYLRDLYRQFGDWKLALAAYNTGETRVQRIIDRTGIRDFDEMARRGLLPLATQNYVPMVLAAWGLDGMKK